MTKAERREYMRDYRRARRAAAEAAEAAGAPRVGDPFAWTPTAFCGESLPGAVTELRGRVVDVNAAHRHYTVEAECNGYRFRECFKF